MDGALTDLTQLKEEIRVLVDQYKQVASTADSAQAPQFTGAFPVVQADHLGASTYIEKGWSLISLGDHAGAIQALQQALQLSPGDTQAQSLLGWAQMLHEDYDDALGTFSQVLMKEPANSLARINVGYICLKKRIFGEAIEHLSKAIRLDNDRKATLYAHFYLGPGVPRAGDVRGRADLLPEDAAARAQPDRGLLRAGPRALVRRRTGRGGGDLDGGAEGQQVQPVGKAVRGNAGAGGSGRGHSAGAGFVGRVTRGAGVARSLLLSLAPYSASPPHPPCSAQATSPRSRSGNVTVVAAPRRDERRDGPGRVGRPAGRVARPRAGGARRRSGSSWRTMPPGSPGSPAAAPRPGARGSRCPGRASWPSAPTPTRCTHPPA